MFISSYRVKIPAPAAVPFGKSLVHLPEPQTGHTAVLHSEGLMSFEKGAGQPRAPQGVGPIGLSQGLCQTLR